MPEALRVRVQSLTGLPQGRCPPLEQLMRLLLVGALPHMHLVTDVPAAPVKFADYYGKIRRIMLHKPKITGQSTHPTSETCNASSEGASDPDIGAYALESETTPDASVNHFMAVKLVILKQFVAVLETFAAKCRAKHSIVGLYSIQTTYCRNMAHKSYSPPKYAFTFGFISAI